MFFSFSQICWTYSLILKIDSWKQIKTGEVRSPIIQIVFVGNMNQMLRLRYLMIRCTLKILHSTQLGKNLGNIFYRRLSLFYMKSQFSITVRINCYLQLIIYGTH